MRNIGFAFGYCLYHLIGKHLPSSSSALFGGVAKAVRAFCGSLILESCGSGVNIEKGALFFAPNKYRRSFWNRY